ncbi:MAG: DUF2460 domain-containing protein, partial [Myxococcota bacterium]
DLQTVVDFFEERRGRLYGFRFEDPLDHKSCAPSAVPAPSDQLLGVGDGSRTDYPLIKTYGGSFAPYERAIELPVTGTLLVEVAGVARVEGGDFSLSEGLISLRRDGVGYADMMRSKLASRASNWSVSLYRVISKSVGPLSRFTSSRISYPAIMFRLRAVSRNIFQLFS